MFYLLKIRPNWNMHDFGPESFQRRESAGSPLPAFISTDASSGAFALKVNAAAERADALRRANTTLHKFRKLILAFNRATA
jgi:hypothetical protein